MYKKITLMLAALCTTFLAQAQNENDALLLGRSYHYGTARNLSLSGATGSLGADFGAINNNPAGIGLYRRSEFSFTPNVLVANTEGEYQNSNTKLSASRFNFNQAGVVFAKAKRGNEYQRSKWKTSNFAVGFNRLANMHADYSYRGEVTESSFVENFANEINAAGGLAYDANGVPFIDGDVSAAAEAAFNTYIVDIDGNDSTRVAAFVPFSSGIERRKTIQRKGGANELAFTYGANYNEKLLIGITLGIPMVSYTQTEILTEEDMSGNNNNDFEYVDLVQQVAIDGTGLNLKIGTIYKPSNNVRFGLALHTPTWYSITDVSTVAFEANTENYQGVRTVEDLPSNLFEYTLQTPMKAIASATTLFGKKGFISADVEWVNYDGMRYNYNGFVTEENAVNNAIQQTYRSAFNLRVGAEAKLDQLAIRGGLAYLGSPYENFSDGAGTTASLGVGYRGQHFYLDIAGQFAGNQNPDLTHTLPRNVAIPDAVITNRTTQISMTAGFRF